MTSRLTLSNVFLSAELGSARVCEDISLDAKRYVLLADVSTDPMRVCGRWSPALRCQSRRFSTMFSVHLPVHGVMEVGWFVGVIAGLPGLGSRIT